MLSATAEHGDRFEVDEFEQRVGWRLDEDHPRFGTDRRDDGFRIGEIDVAEGQPCALPAYLVHQAERAAIEVIARDDVRTGLNQFQNGSNGGHAGGKGEALRAAFEIGDATFERPARRVVRTPVVQPLVHAGAFVQIS